MNKVSTLVFAPALILFTASSGFATPEVATYEGLLHAIRETRAASQARITVAVEQEKVREAWETGKLIDEHVLLNKERAKYGERVIQHLSFDLGMDRSELTRMVDFARSYPIRVPAHKLSWSHYQALLSLNDPKERDEVTKEAMERGWNRDQVREEVQRRKRHTETPVELPEITPGPLDTYQIIRLKDRLQIDLGFGIYRGLSEKDARKFKEGDIVHALPSLRNTGSPTVIARRPEADEAISDLFTYTAVVTQVVDGDTFHALIDLGLETTLAQRVRLRRIDAPEILTSDGKEAKAYLEKILHRDHGRILMKSVDIDQHGRPIADVWVKGKPVDQELLDEGLAVRISE